MAGEGPGSQEQELAWSLQGFRQSFPDSQDEGFPSSSCSGDHKVNALGEDSLSSSSSWPILAERPLDSYPILLLDLWVD